MEAELRAALERCEAALLRGIGFCDGPMEAHADARREMHEARGAALNALDALAASPARGRDSDAFASRFTTEVRDALVQTIREERRRLWGKPNASERLAEAIEHRLAPLLAAHRPVRERATLYRIVGTRAAKRGESIDFIYPSQEDGSPERPAAGLLDEWDEDATNLAPHRLQAREVFYGPWQDVTEGGGA